MRYSQSEKMQIIRLVEESPVSIKQTLLELNINRSTFYKWYRRYQEGGYEALANHTAQFTASTALVNSANKLSPVVSTTRPLYCWIRLDIELR